MKIELEIFGKPLPQLRPRSFNNRGRQVVWSPVSLWRNAIHQVALFKKPREPLTCPLYLELQFKMPRPKQANKDLQWHTKRPDLDNLEKAVIDALQSAKWFKDDSQICHKKTEKTVAPVGEKPGVRIVLHTIVA